MQKEQQLGTTLQPGLQLATPSSGQLAKVASRAPQELPGLSDSLPRCNNRTPVGQIAEMLPGDGHELLITEAAVIEGFDPHNPIQQIAMMVFQVVEQQLAHVVGTTAMTEQQHNIGSRDGCGEACKVVVINGCSLTSLIAIMAMAEVLIGAPDAMGPEYSVLHLFPLQKEHIGVAMVKMQDQATTLIASGGGCISLGMLWGDTGLLEQMAQSHHSVRIQIGMAQSTGGVDPGFLACRQLQPQAPVTQLGDIRPQGAEEGFDLRHPYSVLERMGVESLQRAQMVAFHGEGVPASRSDLTLSKVEQVALSAFTIKDLIRVRKPVAPHSIFTTSTPPRPRRLSSPAARRAASWV